MKTTQSLKLNLFYYVWIKKLMPNNINNKVSNDDDKLID